MSGKMLYLAPVWHRCDTPPKEPLGSVWLCGECGTHWRMVMPPLMALGDWRPMGKLAVWWWKRRNAVT